MSGLWRWLLGIDVGEMAGADRWRLELIADYGPYVRLLLAVGFAALVGLTIRNVRREADASRRIKGVLAGLRIAVFTVLLLALLRPAVVLRYVRQLRSVVVVLVDESLSMGFADTYADAAERGSIAQTAGVAEADLPDASRLDLVRSALAGAGGVLARLGEDHPLVIMGFSSRQTSAEPFSRVVARTGRSEAPAEMPLEAIAPAALLAPLEARGYETDIARAIREALIQTRGRRVGAVVVLSDGQITGDGGDARLLAAVDLANERGAPIVPVLVGDPTPRTNIRVLGLDAPQTARRGATVEMTALVAGRNAADTPIELTLMRRAAGDEPWQATDVKQTVTLTESAGDPAAQPGAVQATRVALPFEPTDLGTFEFRVVARAAVEESDTDDNASRPVQVTVTDDKANILLVGGDAGWEFQFLRNFLIRSTDDYRVSIWQQNADEEINQTASTGMRLTSLPRTLAELIGTPGDETKPGYQAVILLDPRPTTDGFDEAFAGLLDAYVTRHGGGLCYVAGPKHTDTILLNRDAFAELQALMPVTLSPNTVDLAERLGARRPQPWPLRLTAYGRDHQIMRLGATADESLAVWQALPGMFWSHPVHRVKAGARVLAEHANPLRRTTRNAAEPLVALHSPGTGRVAYVGFDSTWRWRLVRDGYVHRRFWNNLIRHLASGGAGKRVTISVGGEHFPAGRAIDVEVEAYDEAFAPLRDPTMDVQFVDLDSGQTHAVTLTAVDANQQPGYYKGRIDPSLTARTGRYRLTALPDHPHAEDLVEDRLVYIELPQAEANNPEANPTVMRALGARSAAAEPAEGFVSLGDVDRLTQWIPSGRRRSVRDVPRELWDSPLMLMLIVTLLSAEWIVRKTANLI